MGIYLSMNLDWKNKINNHNNYNDNDNKIFLENRKRRERTNDSRNR